MVSSQCLLMMDLGHVLDVEKTRDQKVCFMTVNCVQRVTKNRKRMSVRIKESACSHCGKALDSAISTQNPGVRPGPGDVSICIECTNWNKYNENLELEPFTETDRESAEDGFLAEMDRVQDKLRKSKE